MEKKIKILGIAGSLRKNSYNLGLLKAAQEEMPQTCTLEIFNLASIPLFNQDEEAHFPKSVLEFKTKIRDADAILIATPEYNYSFSGVLKNALDWGSRPYGESAWDHKIVALIGASAGMQGTSRAQYHLRQVLLALNMHPLNRPELMVSLAHEKFDEMGNLKDPKVQEQIKTLVAALIARIKK